jgi:hypothetical protein
MKTEMGGGREASCFLMAVCIGKISGNGIQERDRSLFLSFFNYPDMSN